MQLEITKMCIRNKCKSKPFINDDDDDGHSLVCQVGTINIRGTNIWKKVWERTKVNSGQKKTEIRIDD